MLLAPCRTLGPRVEAEPCQRPFHQAPPLSLTQAARPVTTSAVTQKPWSSPPAAMPPPFPLPSPAHTGSLVSPQSPSPSPDVLSGLSRHFLHSSICSGSVTFDLCGLGQILNLWACFPHQESKNRKLPAHGCAVRVK